MKTLKIPTFCEHAVQRCYDCRYILRSDAGRVYARYLKIAADVMFAANSEQAIVSCDFPQRPKHNPYYKKPSYSYSGIQIPTRGGIQNSQLVTFS